MNLGTLSLDNVVNRTDLKLLGPYCVADEMKLNCMFVCLYCINCNTFSFHRY